MKFTKGEAIHTPEFHKKKLKERRIKSLLWTLLVVAVVVLPVILSRVQAFQISSYKFEGNAVTRDEDISKILDEELSESYLWIFPKRNSFIYPKSSLVEDLQNKIPRLSSVELNVVDQTLEVLVTEREPRALYCSDISNLNTPTDCYFLDEKGFIFSQAPAFSGDVYFIFTHPDPLVNPLRKTILSENEYKSLLQFVDDAELIGVNARAIVIYDEVINLILPNKGKIIWNREAEPRKVAQDLDLFLSKEEIKSKRNFWDVIEKIDFTINNKVYWSYNND